MVDVLNPALFEALESRFGDVRVSSEGIAFSSKLCRQASTGEWYEDVSEPGEYYQVCCPFCHDTRYRLYFNHLWGTRGKAGLRLWLAICYNEDCLNKSGRRYQMYEELTEPGPLENVKIKRGKEADESAVIVEWPGPCTRLDRLPDDHSAVQYVVSRHFDPQRLGRFYNVHYCHDSFRWLARDRLIIPVYIDRQLVGWQARFVGELNWKAENAPPKYYTCPGTPRRKVIYNIANAVRYETGVIVEGPTDVWAFGPMACCTLGSTMTPSQRKLFVHHFKNYAAILLYDPDVFKKEASRRSVDKLIRALDGQFKHGFACVKLPDGTDPGSLDRAFLRDYVKSQAAEQDVKVSWWER